MASDDARRWTPRTADRAPASVQTVEAVIRARLSTALGGWRGSVETALPTVAFVGAWVWRHDVTVAVAASAVVALVLLASRLVARQTPRYVLSAVAATAVAAFFALRSGRAEDAFLPGILASAAWGAGALVSVVARWPVVGFVVGGRRPEHGRRPVRLATRPRAGAGLPAAHDGARRSLRAAGRGHAADVPRRRGDPAGHRQARAGLAGLPRCGRRHGADPGAGQHPAAPVPAVADAQA